MPLLLLSLAAVALNLHPPQLFFDQQLMLGSSLAVLALLQFGWRGLVVGIAAYLVTWTSWGHPFALINGSAWLISLQLFLNRSNGGAAQRGNGRVVLATIAYWLLIGLPAEWLWFRLGMGINATQALGLGLKELVTALLNASLGLLLFQGLQLLHPRRRRRDLQIRSLTFSALLLAISLPGLLMILVASQQLNAQVLASHQAAMGNLGREMAQLERLQALPPQLAGLAVRVREGAREGFNSDPELFRRLQSSYGIDRRLHLQTRELRLLTPTRPLPLLVANQQAYWQSELTIGPRRITVVQPAIGLIDALAYDFLLPALSVMAALLIGAVVISEVGGSLLSRQFARALLAARPGAEGKESRLAQRPSFIHELNGLALAIRRSTSELQASNNRYLTFFHLPQVGTAITSARKGWVAVNDETCRILGYSREELFQRTWAELTHPEDLADDEANFGRMLRREIDGYELEKRFIRKDGSVVHTLLAGGCGAIGDQPVDFCYVNLIDISERKRIEADLAAARERERLSEEQHRRLLEQKLKTSLRAATLVHEIKQPLSSILLNCHLAVEQLADLPGGAIPAELDQRLRHLAADSQQVVTTMERMRMLLRNVETAHSRMDLAATLHSSLIFLRRAFRARQVQLLDEGLQEPCPLQGDSAQVQMAALNLIRNALEAMDPQPPPSRRLLLQLQRHHDHLAIVVADSGPGFGADASSDSGMGLFLARTAATNHRGRLRIGRSERLGGAEVVLELPIPAPFLSEAPEESGGLRPLEC
jgi:PAS domain S-box-containing protein